jgi:hypothetical protein
MGRFDALTQLEEKRTPKKLNSDAILNDLKGSAVNRLDGSAVFPAKKQYDSPLPSQPVPRPVRGTVPPTVPLIPKVKRLIKQRQPFDIYEDQYERLKKIAGSERAFINGRGMSQMVREAIDNYLRDHCSSKE